MDATKNARTSDLKALIQHTVQSITVDKSGRAVALAAPFVGAEKKKFTLDIPKYWRVRDIKTGRYLPESA